MTRRQLKFETLNDAVRDAETLLAKGYDKSGNWDYGQVLGHLTCWLTYPLEGFPALPLWLKPIFWVMRNTVAKGMLKKVLDTGHMQEKMSTAPQSVVDTGIDPRKAFEAYKKAVDRWLQHTGDYLPSPLFGVMSKEELTKLHTVHAAHHLSFLVPKA